MKKFLVGALPALLLGALLLAACGKTPGGTGTSTGPTDTVTMTATDFAVKSATVKVGTPIKFTDPATGGGFHIICTGDNGQCTPNADAPKDLGGTGFQIDAGQTKDLTFDKPGTYNITCSVHPAMNLKLTVQ